MQKDSVHVASGKLESAVAPPVNSSVPAECKCDLRTKLVGDGCAVCNPKLAEELEQSQDGGAA